MIRKEGISIFLTCFILAAQKEPMQLTRDEVTILVMNTPAFLALECRKGCPSLDMVPEGQNVMSVQLRNMCPSSGTGLIDNYAVDLRTGEIWTGMDERKFVDSDRLRMLRRVILRGRTSQP